MDADKMKVEQLRQLQAQRYKAAGDDGSLRLLRLVALELGQEMPANYGPKFQWRGENVYVYRDEYGGYTTVVADGRQVCNTHPNVQLYVPGDWMQQVKELASLEIQTGPEGEGVRDEHNRQELRERLGLEGLPAVPLPDEDVLEE